FEFPVFCLRLLLARMDPLHTECALLDDSDFAQRHVGIERKFERPFPYRLAEIKEPYIVRTRIRAISRADASVVDLRVQSFIRMMAGIRRADRLARRGIALLAHHGAK